MSKFPPNAERKFRFGGIAQLVEQLTFNQWVQGSSPCASTRNKNHRQVVFLFCGTAGREPCSTMSKRKRVKRSLSANECGAGIYAEPVPVPPPERLNHRMVIFLFGTDKKKL